MRGNMEQIWYKKSATRFQEALPIGNGKMAAMIYGGAAVETIQMDDSGFWSGSYSENNDREDTIEILQKLRETLLKREYVEADRIGVDFVGIKNNYGTHIPMAFLTIEHLDAGECSFVSRGLDIYTGVARTVYTAKETCWERVCFLSNPDQVMGLEFGAEDGQRFSVRFRFGWAENDVHIAGIEGSDILLEGHAYETLHSDGKSGATMKGRIRILDGGKLTMEEDSVLVSDIQKLKFFAVTDTTLFSTDPNQVCVNLLDAAERKGYDAVLTDHCSDVKELMDRVTFSIGGDVVSELPTDERIAVFREKHQDNGLLKLYFDFGRYAFFASSRENAPLPTHMGGIWNDDIYNKLDCGQDMHIDLNIQMQYWLAGPINAAECMMPLARWMRDTLIPAGEKAAKAEFGTNGWTAHVVGNPWGFASLGWHYSWGVFPFGGVWCATLLWDCYEYSGDREFLEKTAYPIIYGAAQFASEQLFWSEGDGCWMSGPSYSPENWFLSEGKKCCLAISNTCDILMVREIFQIVLRCAELLGYEEDEVLKKIREQKEMLPGYKIGKYGQIQEWFDDLEEAIPNHRHVSHLLGAYPFYQIQPDKTPELAKAVDVSLARRRKGHELTSWGGNILMSLYARLGKGDEVLNILKRDMVNMSEKNMTITMPGTWELDGNTGLVSSLCELFAQCNWNGQTYELKLLPALPAEWSEGEISGVRLRGGMIIDIIWKEGKLEQIKLKAEETTNLWIRYGEMELERILEKGELLCLDGQLQQRERF